MHKKVRNYKQVILGAVLLLLPVCCYSQTGRAVTWTTTSSKRMEQTEKELTTTTKATVRFTLQLEQTYQKIDGFGWMLNQGSAKLLMQLPASDRRAMIEELYGVEGLNASMVRVAIGACDLSESDYTYADSYDATLSNFAIAQQDLTTVVPILQEILSINPKVKVMACSWTAPTWMKNNTAWYNSYVDGTLNTDYYDLYAEYFLKYIEAMEAWGIPIWGLSVQNEPLNGHNDPSMTWTKETMYKFITTNLGPKLRDNNHSNVRIIAYDHNCDVTDFPIYVARSRFVYGTAFHLYAGDISALSTVYNSTGKPVLFTEQYTGKDGDFMGDFTWHIQNVVLGAMNNYATTSMEWNLCSDPNYSIHTSGGCSNCKGALTINGSSLVRRNVSYYIIGHGSRVVDPDAKRIAATCNVDNVTYSAFANPDGSYGIIMYTNAGVARSASVEFVDRLTGVTMFGQCNLPSNGVASMRIIPEGRTPVVTPKADSSTMRKMIRGGKLYIQTPDGRLYDVLGQCAQ